MELLDVGGGLFVKVGPKCTASGPEDFIQSMVREMGAQAIKENFDVSAIAIDLQENRVMAVTNATADEIAAAIKIHSQENAYRLFTPSYQELNLNTQTPNVSDYAKALGRQSEKGLLA